MRQRQIVDAAAFEIDRAAEPRRVDGDARRAFDDRFTGRDLGLRRRGIRNAGCFRRCARRASRAGLGLIGAGAIVRARLHLRLFLLLQLGLLALPLHLRVADEVLPADHHQQ